MPSNTESLNLYKIDPSTDGNSTFNVETMLNENWDKIDNKFKKIGDLNKITEDNLVAAFEKDREKLNEKTTLVLSETEPINNSDNMFWLQDVGENFSMVSGNGLVITNASMNNDTNIKFEQL